MASITRRRAELANWMRDPSKTPLAVRLPLSSVAGRSPERLHAAQTELARPERVRVVTADIGRRAQVKALFEQAGAKAASCSSRRRRGYGCRCR